jgi:glycine oxidase
MGLSDHSPPPGRAVVLGGGVAGLTAAVALAERGVKVEVWERAAQPFALGCSRMAGGMISPWCELEQGCEPVSADSLIARLGLEALDYWTAQVPGMVRRGSLVLASVGDRRALERFAERTQGHQRLNAAGLRGLEPDLEDRFAAGLYFAQEGHLDPREALTALLRRLHDLGGLLRLGVEATPEAVGEDVADVVMDCRGMDGRDRLPDLRGVRGEMLVVKNPDIALTRPVRLLHPRVPVYVVPRGEGVYMLGATMVESDSRAGPAARALADLIASACLLHPGFAEAEVLEIGAEVRPTLPDNLPRIRRRGRVVSINGFYRHGFLAAPGMARMAEAVVLDGAHFPGVTDDD